MNKPHIAIFGRCNAGKSSLMNFITGAPTAIVSPQPGTTTDTVRKHFEILGFAPAVVIDTAGTDDRSELGRQRVERSLETIYQSDLAILVFRDWGREEEELAERFRSNSLPFIPVHNAVGGRSYAGPDKRVLDMDVVNGSAADRDRLLDEIKRLLPEKSYRTSPILGGRAGRGDIVLLVCPVDSEAPAGRLILPQVQAIRELLDNHALALVVQPEEVEGLFSRGIAPSLVITDSQVLKEVRAMISPDIEVTTFSILLAAAKGDYDAYLRGLEAVDSLEDGDRIIIAENCSHQTSCDDIGRVKIPAWLEQHTGKKLRFTFVPALTPLPDDLSEYALMVQCGGCMVTRNQLQNRIRRALEAGVPITNYGMLIRKIRG